MASQTAPRKEVLIGGLWMSPRRRGRGEDQGESAQGRALAESVRAKRRLEAAIRLMRRMFSGPNRLAAAAAKVRRVGPPAEVIP
jgi:hypothetical protein